jgi:predicted RNA-binding protein with PIN domain
MGCDVLVDGYNVIKNSAMFQFMELKSRAEARTLLVRQLRSRFMHSTDRVIVVFDGDGVREQVSHEDHVRIIFSRHGETADAVIKRLTAEARQAGRAVMMYSNDGEVRSSVVEQGGSVRTTVQLTRQLTAAPRDVEARALHRMAMRRMYGIDPMYKGDDEPERTRPRSRKKKKAKHRGR